MGGARLTAPVKLIDTTRHGDARGWFVESYRKDALEHLGIAGEFVQDNHSYSADRFTLRGLHFQAPPAGQDKLIRCIRGRIFDVAVDVRSGSPTFGKWLGCELSAANGRQLFVPIGFAHGFLTLEPDCEIVYKCSAFYAPNSEGGIVWNDPGVGIAWPLPAGMVPTLSAKDEVLPVLSRWDSPFGYDGQPLESIDGCVGSI